MTAPVHKNWNTRPGNWDLLKTLQLQPGEGRWSIPRIPMELGAPDWLEPYDEWDRKRRREQLPKTGRGGVHFFIQDYRFESAWNNPDRALVKMGGADFILSPDFSAYRDWPLAIQLWNRYRANWLGAYWQSKGARVIPTVGWSTEDSFEFCFDGFPRGSVVALSTVGCFTSGDLVAPALFTAGYREMCRRLAPVGVVLYGERFPAELEALAPVRHYKPWQLQLRRLDAKPVMPPIVDPLALPEEGR